MREVRNVSLPRRSLVVIALAFSLALLGGTIASAAEAPERPTEPFFPRSGNRGYDGASETSR